MHSECGVEWCLSALAWTDAGVLHAGFSSDNSFMPRPQPSCKVKGLVTSKHLFDCAKTPFLTSIYIYICCVM